MRGGGGAPPMSMCWNPGISNNWIQRKSYCIIITFFVAFLILFSTSLPTEADPEFVSTKKATLKAPPRWIEPDTNRPGGDYAHFPLDGGAEECREACEQDGSCKAYTYVKPAEKGRAHCYLKSSIPLPVPDSSCISGVKIKTPAAKDVTKPIRTGPTKGLSKPMGSGDDSEKEQQLRDRLPAIGKGGITLVDSDSDGVPDVKDRCHGSDDHLDADGDSVPDDCDYCPENADKSSIEDLDQIVDSDEDTVPDECDTCPYDEDRYMQSHGPCSKNTQSTDDDDLDGDGVLNDFDYCPEDASKSSIEDLDHRIDSDEDTVPDECDACPYDDDKYLQDHKPCRMTSPSAGGGNDDPGSDYNETIEEKPDIVEEMGMGLAELRESEDGSTMPYGEGRADSSEDTPYQRLSLTPEDTELMITDIRLRNPDAKDLLLQSELSPGDWIIEVKVINGGMTPAHNVDLLVGIGQERYQTFIQGPLEKNKPAGAVIFITPANEWMTMKQVKVTAIVDPDDDYKEKNEKNNYLQKTVRIGNLVKRQEEKSN